ncbi:UNVERIFIED_CONTAM: hypothetical protein O8I53_08685 [Campylobacter lari]
MKKYLAVFKLNTDKLEFKVYLDKNSIYNLVFEKSLSYVSLDIANLKNFLNENLKTLNKKINIYKNSKINYAIVLNDELATKSQVKFRKVENTFDLVNHMVDETLIENIKNPYYTGQFDPNILVLNYQNYLYELIDESDDSKMYCQLPLNKKGNKLVVYSSLLTLNKDQDLAKMISVIKDVFEISEIKLSSELKDIEVVNNKYK